MALNVAYATGSAVTVSSTAISLINGTTSIASATDVGVYQVVLDASAMLAGDQYELYMYEKAISGGTQRTHSLGILYGVQSWPLAVLGSFFLGVGWDFGIKKLAGTDRAFSWSVRRVS